MKNKAMHFVFNSETNKLKCFKCWDESGKLTENGILLKWKDRKGKDTDYIEMRENAIYNDAGYHGTCPPGTYRLGVPQKINPPERAFGFWFTPLIDDGEGDFKRYGRSGVGIHAGGSGLFDPYEPYQGWILTHGCLRLQNADNQQFAHRVIEGQKHGNCYITVV